MVVLVIVLAVIAAAAIVTAAILARRLTAQRRLVAESEERAAEQAEALAGTSRDLDAARRQHAAAIERIAAADSRTQSTEGERDAARADTEVAVAARIAAEERATAAEVRADQLAARHAETAGGSVDAELLWALERRRSDRLWRLAAATSPDVERAATDTPLADALQVELDVARDEVGSIVDLELSLPAEPPAAASLLTLRVAQELLAGVVRRADETTLRIRAEGRDIVLTVEPVDGEGEPVQAERLAVPTSLELEATEDGARVRNAFSA